MSSKTKGIGLIIIILLISLGIVAVSFRPTSSQGEDLSLTADAYYLSKSEIAGTENHAHVEGESAKPIGETITGSYKGIKKVETLEEYKKDYKLSVGPVYIGRDISQIDSYTKDPLPDDTGTIYGEPIYIFDNKTIAHYDAETGLYWIGKKKDGSIDIEAIEKLLESNIQVETYDIAGDEEDFSDGEEDFEPYVVETPEDILLTEGI